MLGFLGAGALPLLFILSFLPGMKDLGKCFDVSDRVISIGDCSFHTLGCFRIVDFMSPD